MNLLRTKHVPQTSSSSETNQRVYAFIRRHSIGVLSTVAPDQMPHAAVIYFAVDPEFNITFTTKRDTQKHVNILHDNHALLVDYEASSQTTVQIAGTVEEVTDSADANKSFINMLKVAEQTSESGIPPISKLDAGQYIAYRIRPKLIRMAVFIRPDPGSYDMYETIEF